MIIAKLEHPIWSLFMHIPKIGICEIISLVRETSLTCSYLFPAYTKIYLSKNLIPYLFTVGSSKHSNTVFGIHFHISPPLGLVKIVCGERNVPRIETEKWRRSRRFFTDIVPYCIYNWVLVYLLHNVFVMIFVTCSWRCCVWVWDVVFCLRCILLNTWLIWRCGIWFCD